jgi:hypothetical protein
LPKIPVKGTVSSSSGGGTGGRAIACQSTPGSGSWKDAIISKIGLPSWPAVIRRVEIVRPSRVRSTSNRTGSAGWPGRMK